MDTNYLRDGGYLPGTYTFLYDSQETQYRQNYKKNRRLLLVLGWDENSISYNINNYGYRSDVDFVQGDECNVFLGCSYTLGDEIPYTKTWPFLVNAKLNDHKLYNLGVSGCGPETCYRVLKGFLNIVDIKRVFVLLPNTNRREIFYKDEWIQITATYSKNILDKRMIDSLFSPQETYINKLRSIDAIKYICSANNIPVYMLDMDSQQLKEMQDNDKTARDLAHMGIKSHEKIAEIFLKNLTHTHKVL